MDKRLVSLRQKLREHELSGFLIPHTDEHQSEYTPSYAERLAWITGFDGSAGFGAVTQTSAAVLVDGRYTIQAKKQVDELLFSRHSLDQKSIKDWLFNNTEQGGVIGYDPWLHSKTWLKSIAKKLSEKNIILKAITVNPIDAIWTERPIPSKAEVSVHKEKYSGEKSSCKRKRIATIIKAKKADALVITSLDSIAWLLNIRGTDVDCTPLVLSFAILYGSGELDFFMDVDKINPELEKHLGSLVTHYDKKNFEMALMKLGSRRLTVLADPKRSHAAVFEALESGGAKIIEVDDPCQLDKACKNDIELSGARNAHIRDAVAVCRFLCWLDEHGPSGKIDEINAVNKLYGFRTEVPLFQGNSFDTISGAGPNGAIVHYRVTEKTSLKLEKGMIYLVDSGGQYLDGTTDITRTVPIGAPTKEQCDNFTRVLKGHIAVACACFPVGRTGAHIDTLARKSLWEVGLDYDHGTGHGVGSYLGVHEGPQSISPFSYNVALTPGMILSNEPGYYKTGQYGIRIENLVIVRNSDLEGEGRPMLNFETITMVPISTKLVNVLMMSREEINWLNTYHSKVREKLFPLLDETEKKWLVQATEAIAIN